ncbi:hypothetical protein BDV29DRAFT_24706 [Aspergillus leporis]|uniref:BED-type domain-containing protein n=1 Tax=Aspergillus leporis TaxID=41062 RepID=A0A5N5XBF1_9EURO|nr:hypothetical protein BDV29DRAFT_24706 [Aspergillus leporis]
MPLWVFCAICLLRAWVTMKQSTCYLCEVLHSLNLSSRHILYHMCKRFSTRSNISDQTGRYPTPSMVFLDKSSLVLSLATNFLKSPKPRPRLCWLT